MNLIYFFIAIMATSIGGIAGIGGGIIIKPCLDTIGAYDVATIGMLSSITVLCMAAASSVKFLNSGIIIETKKAVVLSVGAAVGGGLGKYGFGEFSHLMEDERAKGIQAVLLVILLVFVLFRNVYPHYTIQNTVITTLCGLFVGGISSFLGIGGGPINVAVICIVFSVSVRDAAVYSIFTVFFSQLTTVISNAITPGMESFDLTIVVFMIPGAIMGALIGSYLNRRLSEKKVDFLFSGVMALLLVLNVFNVYRFLL